MLAASTEGGAWYIRTGEEDHSRSKRMGVIEEESRRNRRRGGVKSN